MYYCASSLKAAIADEKKGRMDATEPCCFNYIIPVEERLRLSEPPSGVHKMLDRCYEAPWSSRSSYSFLDLPYCCLLSVVVSPCPRCEIQGGLTPGS